MDVRPAPAPYGQQPLASVSTAGSYYSPHQNMQASQSPQQAVPVTVQQQQQPIAPMYRVDQARHGQHMSPSHPYASNVPPITMPGSQQAPSSHGQQHPLSMVSVKGKRKRASPQQLQILNKVFAETSFPSTETRNQLAQQLQMTPRTVQIWFQNKRQAARMKDTSGNGPRLSNHIRPKPSTNKSMSPVATSSRRMSTSSHSAASSTSPVANSALSVQSSQQNKSSASPVWSEESGAVIKPALGYMISSAPTAISTPPPVTPTSATYAQQPAIMTPPPPMPHSAEPVVLSRKPDMPAMVTTFSSDHLIPSAVRSSSFISDRGFNPQLQHTRRDPWFSNDRSTGKMGYLYSNSTPSQVSFMRSKSDCNSACNTALPQLQQHSAQRSYSLMPPTMNSPTSLAYSEKPAAPAVSSSNPSSRSALTPPDAVPVQRSMSLLAMLDAPPEQRTLPPLPPLPHHP